MTPEDQKFALDFLAKADRTEAELRTALARRDLNDEQIESILDWLRRKRLLDDTRVAERVVDQSLTKKHEGTQAAVRRLNRRGVPEEIQAEVLANVPPETDREKAIAFIHSRKWKTWQQAARALISRGFDEETTEWACEQLPGFADHAD